jgi:NTP pyrophosphatase (non-canonical NTP hydrolase)
MALHLFVFSAEMSRGRVRLTGNQWELKNARSVLVPCLTGLACEIAREIAQKKPEEISDDTASRKKLLARHALARVIRSLRVLSVLEARR